MKTYCKPWEAGLDSCGRSVATRLGRLLTALDREVTDYVIEGQCATDIAKFKRELIAKLNCDGWTVRYSDATHRYVVSQPRRK